MSKKSNFVKLLTEQVGHEFQASQQYIAVAVWFDTQDLPALAKTFYKHSVGERNHAMMIVQYMMDRDLAVEIPPVTAIRNNFVSPADAIEFALMQEKNVTEQIENLFRVARSEDDALGEQFILWFLREQVEEVANMSTLVTVSERAGTDWFQIEQYLYRNSSSGAANTGTPPAAAGGAL